MVVGRNVDWKQNVSLGAKQNQTFAFIHPREVVCLRAIRSTKRCFVLTFSTAGPRRPRFW